MEEKKKRRPKGDGSVQQLAPNKFKIAITIGRDNQGKQVRKSFTGKTQGEVIKKLNEFKTEQVQGTLVRTDNIKLSEFIKRWLETKEGQTKKTTYESYVYTCDQHIIPTLGKLKVQKITTASLNDYIKSKLKGGLSPASITRQRAILHNILDLAVKEGIVPRNVAEHCMTIKLEREETKTLSPEDITNLLNVAKDIYERDKGKGNKFYQIYHIVLIALATGARRGEILALRWSNIDLEKNTIAIKENLVEVKGGILIETPKTKTSRRVIAIDPKVLEQLDELREVNRILYEKKFDSDEPGYVFYTRYGNPITPSNMSRAWRDLIAETGMEGIRFHDLRHTHATLLVASGTNIKTVSSRIGHNDTRITLDLYSHALPEKDREAAEKSGGWLFK